MNTQNPSHTRLPLKPREARTVATYKGNRVDPKDSGPFNSSAYSTSRKVPLFDIPLAVDVGFPQGKAVQLWIPGVSTPEGLLLTASASMLLLNAVANGGEAMVKAIEVVASTVFVLVITGIPVSITWLSTQVLYPRK